MKSGRSNSKAALVAVGASSLLVSALAPALAVTSPSQPVPISPQAQSKGLSSKGAVTVLDAPVVLAAKSKAVVRIRKAAQMKSCSFAATSGKARTPKSVFRTTGPVVTMSWLIPATAGTNQWTVSLKCAAKPAQLRKAKRVTLKLRIEGKHRGSEALIRPGTFKARSSLKAPVLPIDPGTQGDADEQAGVGAGGNPFDYGQCTYHAYETRSDIYERALTAGVPRGGKATNAVYGGIPDWWWNGWRWADNARRGGFEVGTTPAVGALAVYPRNWGGSPVGHVAYVIGVNSNGTYRTSDRNVIGPNISTHLRYPTAGVQFVYGGPAGSPPGGTSPPGGGGGDPAGQPGKLGDFSGDGMSDVLYQDPGSTTWHLLTSAGTKAAANSDFVTNYGQPTWQISAGGR